MSEDDEDPFEQFDAPEDREGDPFERLGEGEPADEQSEETADSADETAAADEPAFEEEFIDADDPFSLDGEANSTSEALSPGETAPTDTEQSPGETGPADAGQSPGQAGPADEPASPGGDDDPFAGMSDREGDPFDGGESAFEAVDVEGVDPDEVWESLQNDAPTQTYDESRYVEVSKHRFCEQCEHFASPPVARCTHDEAEIIEYLDMETVRLLDCPVVAEHRQLEDEG